MFERPIERDVHAVAAGDDAYQPAVAQDDRGPVWVFSGQGSQWAGMGRDLLDTEPAFAAGREQPVAVGVDHGLNAVA